MDNMNFEPAFTETELKEIERSCQHNIEQFCINRRVALSVLGFDKEDLCKRIASDPKTYKLLLQSLGECMDSLKVQIAIIEKTQARLSVVIGEQMGLTGDLH